MALMAAKGEITPMPDFAVFADTQAEPQSVYDYLEYLKEQLPFPVHVVSRGDLRAESLRVHHRIYDGAERVNNIIPVFGLAPNGKVVAAIGRKCTADYKISPIRKLVRKLCEIERGQRDLTVTQWIGISWDEIQRVKESQDNWCQHRWPLVERKIQRHDCVQWIKDNGFLPPPRSACTFCPFHSDSEWRRLRNESPDEFASAVQFDKELRELHREKNQSLKMEVYLHRSCKPLDEVDFDNDEDKGQQVWDFNAECEGMCGV
jgi:hypothetical protein